MKAIEKNAARHQLEDALDETTLGSDEWRLAMQNLRKFDREHPNIWVDDPE